jgi:hypothetical protein
MIYSVISYYQGARDGILTKTNETYYDVICNTDGEGIDRGANNVFLDYPSSETLTVKKRESQIITKSLRAYKPKGLNKIAKIG